MKRFNERGEVVVEASIVVTIVVIFVAIMFYIGMVLYQQSLVSVMANQTASNIAQVYSNNIKDPFTGYVDPESVYQSVTYSNMKTDAYMDVIDQKAHAFAKYRLKSSRILASGAANVDVELVKKPNELLKSQVVVTVNDSYDLPLVSFFNVSNALSFTATGRADCVDLMEYMNGVQAIGDPENSSVTFLPDMDNCRVTFIADRENPSVHATVIVLRGKSILSSNRYTHSAMPADPVRGTYTFNGWRTEAGGIFTASTVVDGDIVVYGDWLCKVTLEADGGIIRKNSSDSGSSSYMIEVAAGHTATLPGSSGYPSVTRSGYKFKGWYTGHNGSGDRYVSNDTRIEKDITLYASWECTHEGPDGFQWVRRQGRWCNENPHDIYRCARCGAEKKVKAEGEHNTNGRCNGVYANGQRMPHEYWHTEWTWYGNCGTHTYHGYWCAVCTRCKKVMSLAPCWIDGHYYGNPKWCGSHNNGRTMINVHN